MLNKQRIWVVILGLAAVIIVSCTSQEYSSAKLYIQQNEWEKAKNEWKGIMTIEKLIVLKNFDRIAEI